jgi:hypothetical protein
MEYHRVGREFESAVGLDNVGILLKTFQSGHL